MCIDADVMHRCHAIDRCTSRSHHHDAQWQQRMRKRHRDVK